MRVLFTVGYQNEPINDTILKQKGMGGSEYCVINLAKEFEKKGHEVIITGEVSNSQTNNLKFIDYDNIDNNQHFDVVIASNYIHYFKVLEDKNITFDSSYFWIHNLEFYSWYNGETLPNDGVDYLNHPKLTNIIAVSEWQKGQLVKKYNLNSEKVKVIGNAINPSDFDSIQQEKFKDKVIYTSGPDRGLWNLLNIWDDLKNINPNLTLWVASPPYTNDWDTLERIKKDYPTYERDFDVHYLGSLNPSELYKQIKSSEWWIYPSQYPETYCITALEMMMGRVKLLSSDTGNLKHLLDNKSTLISSHTHESGETPFEDSSPDNYKWENKNTGLMRYTFIAAFAFSSQQVKEHKKLLDSAEQFARKQNWSDRYVEWYNLVNDKLPDEARGFTPPEDFGFEKLHPELYTYWDNKDEWTKKFISYSARTKEWDLIVDEPFDSCFQFPLFTEEFCKMIREEAEHSNRWTFDRHENYPTTDMLITEIGMDEIYNDVLKDYVMQVAVYLWALEGKGWDSMSSENFLAKYIPTAQGHLGIHHDRADITCLVQLSDLDEYEGGGTWFRRQKKLVKNPIGYATLHPGNITHKHGARATTKGTRYIVVSFMENRES